MDKTFLVTQLTEKLQVAANHATRFADEARVEAKTGASRAVNLAKGTRERATTALADLAAVSAFKPLPPKKGAPIGLGALVEIEGDETGKTVFLAPAGAGEELLGPGGDGFFLVVTPNSPLGRALLGKRVGDVVETMVNGEVAEWSITFVG